MSLVDKVFGSYSKKEIKRIKPTLKKILGMEEKYKKFSESELKGQTKLFKKRLADGESLDDILPEVFAVCREAASRVLSMRHFEVQLMAGIILHQGRIAEMKTGQGKTLVATLPVYLNALTGKGAHVITVNDYLAKRDSDLMGKVYRYLGLSVGVILNGMDNDERRKAYSCDVTYATNN